LLTDRPLLLASTRPSRSPLPSWAITTTFPFASSTSISFLFLYFSLLYFSTSLTWFFYFSFSLILLYFSVSASLTGFHRLPPASTGFSHPLAQNARMAQFPARDALKRNRMTNLGHSHRKAPQSK
jgi:hypothetical protein